MRSGSFRSFSSSILSVVVALAFAGCGNDSSPPNQAAPAVVATAAPAAATISKIVDVKAAPFDVFPTGADFGFKLQFSTPVVSRLVGRSTTPTVSISPTVSGVFRWTSDSELSFLPIDPLPSGATYEVDLSSLKLNDGLSLSTNKVRVVLPEPNLTIAECGLKTISSDPIIKRVSMSMFLNFPLEGYYRGSGETRNRILQNVRSHVSLTRLIDGEELSIPVTIDLREYSLTVDATGNDMLRPGKDGLVRLRVAPGILVEGGKQLPGTECEAKFLDTDWRTELTEKLANSEAAKVPSVTFPTLKTASSYNGMGSITVNFLSSTWSTTTVSHKHPNGEIIEKGLTLDPSVPGEWRVSSDSEITFTPSGYWTPNKEYSVTIDPKEFPELDIKNTKLMFHAHGLRASFSSVDSGTVPEDRARRVVSARLDFNYPIDAEKLEKVITLSSEEKGRVGSKQSIKFSVAPTDDKHSVYVRSEALELREYPLVLTFSLNGGVESTVGGASERLGALRTFDLPSKLEIFAIRGADISVAKSSQDELQRVITVTTSEDVEAATVTQNISLHLLPNCKEIKNMKLCNKERSFSNEAQVTSEVLKSTEQIPLVFVTRSENGSEETFSYSFQAPGDRQVLIQLKQGLSSKLGFPLAKPYRSVLHLKDYPKRLNVMMDGSLLSLSGSRRLGVLAQNIQRIKYRLSRVKATDLHHLVYLATGSFTNAKPDGTLTYDDLSHPYEFVEELPQTPSGKPAYTSIDFARFMSTGSELPRGLFYLEVNEATKADTRKVSADAAASDDGSENSECEDGDDCSTSDSDDDSVTTDSRLVLLTDLGLVVKQQLSGDHKVYVASFRKGEPVSGAQVKLISRNGSALFTALTDKNGEVSFPKADNFAREKEPVLYVAEKDGDLTFIPYQRRDRQVNLSRFDVGGIVSSDEPDALRALLFTDRGIYRPGETVKFGLTVRNRDLSPLMSEVPLMVRVTDPRGQSIAQDTVRFPRLGIADYTFESTESGTTGTYRAAIIIPARGKKSERELAALDFRIEEFEPDRLSITAKIGSAEEGMFKALNGLQGLVTLKNLFGVPAVENTVKASVIVDPWSGFLSEYPGYNFRPMLDYENRQRSILDLGEVTTDEEGNASIDISIPEVSGVVLETILSVEGFEKESGRSVSTNTRGLVTDLSLLLGAKSNDPLDYIERSAVRRLDLQAINLKGEKVASGKITVNFEREEYKNVLVKQANGVYKYDSAKKMTSISKTDIEVAAEGRTMELETQTPGTFVVSFTNEDGVMVNRVRYTVVGEGNDSIRVNRNANLELALNKSAYAPQSEVELSIKAPYSGFGVISIEREKVLSSTWFKMDGTSSVQKVKLPTGIFGNAYVTVLLARSWDSKEIYLPPLSYASLPITIEASEYVAPPTIEVPSVVKPGQNIAVTYNSKENGAIVVYAVDEGILQFGKYRAPDPYTILVPKLALEVETRTALDLVMPDYSIVQSVLSAGGDESTDLSKFQNPFKKRRRPPLAVWSGVMEVKAGKGEYSFTVPDYFDGAVKVFAYFVGEKRVGISQSRTEIRGDFVIKPTVPTFAAPGDVFDLPVEVTNTLSTAQDAKVSFEADDLEIIGERVQTLSLKPSIGQVALFKVKAREKLGETQFRISATGATSIRTLTDGISIRPATPLMRTVAFGVYDPEKPGDSPEKVAPTLRDMFGELRNVDAYISHSPGLFVDSLQQFMQQYPYSCSEQLTSKAFISLLMSTTSQDPLIKASITKQVEKAIRTIATRMNADGSIAYWQRGEAGHPFVSVYAAHLMTEAGERGISVPKWVSDSSKEYLSSVSRQNVFTLEEIFPQAYALYLRARAGEVVTPQLDSMAGRLSAIDQTKWKGSALSWLIASTYKQLRLEDTAKTFAVDTGELRFSDLPFPLYMPTVNYGLINYLKVRHFGLAISKDTVFSLLNRLETGAPDSLSASSLALGLLAGSDQPEVAGALEVRADGNALPLTQTSIHRAVVPYGAKTLKFVGPKDRHYFYSLVESGFDRAPAQQGSKTQGVSVSRDVVDADGKSVTELEMGTTYTVVLRVRSDKSVQDFALQDLLPAGFEPDLEALKERRSVGNESDAWSCENVDVRDDRLILFGDLSEGTVVFSYPLKPTVKGQLVWPGLYGEAMYDSRVYSWEKATSIVIR